LFLNRINCEDSESGDAIDKAVCLFRVSAFADANFFKPLHTCPPDSILGSNDSSDSNASDDPKWHDL